MKWTGKTPLVLLTVLVSTVPLAAQVFRSVKTDRSGDVRATKADGRTLRLTTKGGNDRAEVSPDQRTVAWLKIQKIDYQGQMTDVSDTVCWYRAGASHCFRSDGLVREYWFVDGGSRIGVNVGGMHFAGENILLDASTGRDLVHLSDSDRGQGQPEWLRGH